MPTIPVNLGRPFEDDDPTEWESLPTDHPHDVNNCSACSWYDIWTDNEKVYIREWKIWSYKAFSGPDVGVDYPRRFRAILDHHYAVRRSAHAARANMKAGPTP